MALYVVRVPNPAPGADWRTMVPGQYLWHVTGVAATLTTGTGPPGGVVDSTANANGLTVNPARTDAIWGVSGPFGGGGGRAVRSNVTGIQNYLAKGPNGGQYDVATFTCEALINVNAAAPIGFQVLIGLRRDGLPDLTLRWMFGILNNVLSQIRVAASSGDVFNIPGVFPENSWHHVAVTYDGAQWVGYVDGVATGTVVGHPPTVADTLCDLTIGGDIPSVQTLHGDLASCALFSGLISPARIAAHAAAVATSSAAYRAAVLADNPIALWMLDEVNSSTTRSVALSVTDGTHSVGTWPAPFPVTAAPGPYGYSWAPTGTANTQTPGAGTTTVAIPALILPAGYTIGTVTPDIQSTDQWSNVSVWWDDDVQQLTDPGNAYAYLGALLTYHQQVGVTP